MVLGIGDLGKYLQLLLQGKYMLLLSHAWHSRGQGTSPLCSSNHNNRIHACKWTGYGMKHCPACREGAKHPSGLGMTQGIGGWRQDGRSEATLSWVRREWVQRVQCHLVLGWKDGVWPILCTSQGVFCEWKPSLISNSNIPAVKQHSIQPTAVTDICYSKGRWKRGLGSARSTMHCMGERKLLLIMSMGTDVFLGLTPPHVPPRYLARRKGMTALARGDSLSHGEAAFPHSSPSNQLANKHVRSSLLCMAKWD